MKTITLYKRIPNATELNKYTHDLQTMTGLRNNAEGEERERYDNIIKCMQLVLIKVNGGKDDKTIV